MIGRRRYQFSLQQLLLLVALVGIVLSLVLSVRNALNRRLSHVVTRLAFSPDGKALAAAVYTHRRVQLPYPTLRIVAADCQMAFHVWDLRSSSGRWMVERRELRGQRIGWPTRQKASGPSIAFSPDSRLLATANIYGHVALWEVDTKKRLQTFAARDDLLCAVGFAPDGENLVVGGLSGLHVWHLGSGERGHSWIKGRSVFSLAVSPDGKLVASTDVDGSVELWDLRSGEHLRTLHGHRSPLFWFIRMKSARG
ncbi:MAG: WD40 repeat domain-containing protein [Planctomycetota bacterium]|jgi:WD40 repeat protein